MVAVAVGAEVAFVVKKARDMVKAGVMVMVRVRVADMDGPMDPSMVGGAVGSVLTRRDKMIRYEEVNEEIGKLANELIAKHFPELTNVKIKVLFDTKKRMSSGKIVLGCCRKTNDLVKHFTAEEAVDEEGYQYVITLDKVVWTNIADLDRERLLRHELRHVLVDQEARQPYRIYPHNIEDFVEEVQLNTDDPDWARRVASLAAEIYDQMTEDEVA